MSDRVRSSVRASILRQGVCAAASIVTLGLLGPALPPGVAQAECQVIGSLDTSGRAYGIACVGDHVLVADGEAGLAVVDVGDPANPVLSGVCPFPGGGHALHLAADGSHAYLGGTELCVDDWSDPAHPFEAGRLTIGWPYGVAVRDDLVYLADHDYGLKIVDVSNPAMPVMIGQVNGCGGVHRVAVQGQYAYLVGCNYRLTVVDVSVPTAPQLVSTGVFWFGAFEGLAVSGNRLYTSGNGELLIFDLSDPTHPEVIGWLDLAFGRGLALRWPFVYVSSGTESSDSGSLVVVDVSVPTAPNVVRTIANTGYAWGLCTDGAFVYGAVGYGGVKVFSLEGAPEEVGATAPPRSVDRLRVWPNPTRGPATLQLDLVRGGPARLEWFDPTGRLLSSRDLGRLEAGRSSIPIDGREFLGPGRAASQCYLRVVHPGGATDGKVILIP